MRWGERESDCSRVGKCGKDTGKKELAVGQGGEAERNPVESENSTEEI